MASPTREIWRRRRLYLMDWSSMQSLVERIARRMQMNAFRPDCIVAIARGGLVPGVQLAHILNIPDLHILRVTRCKSNLPYSDKQVPVASWLYRPDSLSGRDVLLVDDIAGTGESLLSGARLVEKDAARLRTAVLVKNAHARVEPDYSGTIVDDWVVFPWEQIDETAHCVPIPLMS